MSQLPVMASESPLESRTCGNANHDYLIPDSQSGVDAKSKSVPFRIFITRKGNTAGFFSLVLYR